MLDYFLSVVWVPMFICRGQQCSTVQWRQQLLLLRFSLQEVETSRVESFSLWERYLKLLLRINQPSKLMTTNYDVLELWCPCTVLLLPGSGIQTPGTSPSLSSKAGNECPLTNGASTFTKCFRTGAQYSGLQLDGLPSCDCPSANF